MIRHTIDYGRFAEAISHAGIDPREWVKMAKVEDVFVDESGVYVDVITMPDEMPYRARMTSLYSGKDFGLYFPVQKNDLVLLFIPDGNGDAPCWCIGALPNEEDKLPSDITSQTSEIWLISNKNTSVNIKCLGNGEVRLEGAKIRLGDMNTNISAVRFEELKSSLSNLIDVIISKHPDKAAELLVIKASIDDCKSQKVRLI